MTGTTAETVMWLLRHPEPEESASGLCYGSLDLALSAAGIRQAHVMARALDAEPFAAVYTSPRQRCRQAAEILAAGHGCAVDVVDALRELDFGAFEGRTYDEIAQRYPELYRQWMERPTETRFPGGETFTGMRSRVLAASQELQARHCGESMAVVTHGGVIRILLADALGMEPAKIFRIGQRYGAINRVRYFGELPLVDLVNGSTDES